MLGIFRCAGLWWVGFGWVGFGWARTTNQFRSISTQDSYAVLFSICVRVWALSLFFSQWAPRSTSKARRSCPVCLMQMSRQRQIRPLARNGLGQKEVIRPPARSGFAQTSQAQLRAFAEARSGFAQTTIIIQSKRPPARSKRSVLSQMFRRMRRTLDRTVAKRPRPVLQSRYPAYFLFDW